MADKIKETEEQLINTAQVAVSRCNWVVGECAAKWTKKYARGRTDGAFAEQIGLTPDQVYQRRRVWESFADVYTEYESLKWSHFYVALNWDDAAECLQWADENEATVSEMRAWRRSVQGEDLETAAEEYDYSEWGGDPSVVYVPLENKLVKEPSDGEPAERGPRGERSGSGQETAPAFAREAGGEYTPFRKDAASPAPASRDGGTAVAEKSELTAEQLVKKLIAGLERFDRDLSPALAREMRQLPEKLRTRLLKALNEVNSKISKIY